MNNKRYYFQMLRIRMLEEEIAKRYKEGKMRCPVHLSIGQEAAAVGVCASLRNEDKLVSTHRGHAHYLAKGGSMNALIAELYGKSTGCSRGSGGSMHLLDLHHGFYGSTSIVAGTIPVGVGLAFADKLQGKLSKTVVCLGDAGIEEGVFYEAANFAELHKLRVIFVCENNMYSCFTHIRDRQAQKSLMFAAYASGMHYGKIQKPNDVLEIEDHVRNINRFPYFLEIPTYRYYQHCGPAKDDDLGYRSQEEVRKWQDLDPLAVNLKRGDATNADLGRIMHEIHIAFAKAEEAPPAEYVSAYAP